LRCLAFNIFARRLFHPSSLSRHELGFFGFDRHQIKSFESKANVYIIQLSAMPPKG